MARKDDMNKLLEREKKADGLVASIAGKSSPAPIAATADERQPEPATKLAAEPNKLKPVKKETRSAKFQALFTPSLKRQAEKKAKQKGFSLNEVLNQLLENWTESED